MSRDLRDVLEAIQAGIVVLDGEGRVEHVNATACRFLDVSPRAAEEVPLATLLGEDHPLTVFGREVQALGTSAQKADLALPRRAEAALLVDVAASPLFDARGRTTGTALVLRDRTLQKRLQELEAEHDRYESLGRIAAGLAHEVKNPLSGIRGAAELLERRATEDKTRHTAGLIVRESIRIAQLVEEFMVFARRDELKLRPINIHRVLDEVLGLLVLDPVGQAVRIERQYDPSLPELMADPDRLAQVFLNLGRNACEAMAPDGGTLSVRTRMTLDHRITTPEGRMAPTLAVWFEDTGPGFAEDVRRRAKTPFFTTRAEGTGLGLAVAEYWVSRHGGTLHLEEDRERGARIRVAVPLLRPDAVNGAEATT